MRILIASPLYPPDIAEPAPYIKELARRLSDTHSVTIATYAKFPERVDGVKIIYTSKGRPLPLRLAAFTYLLWKAAREADVMYAENGPSVELPVAIVALLTNTPLYVHLGDQAAHGRAQKHFVIRTIERFFLLQAKQTVPHSPLSRPEILPFEARPNKELANFEQSWQEHISILKNILKHENE